MNSYATGPGSRVYHIVVKRGGYTLCGLKVIGLKSVLPDKGSGLLYVVREEPKDRPLCKHCQRLKQSSNG
jgi:hypothetical protein